MPATTDKPPSLAKELAALERMTAAELRDKYAEVFGEPAASGNRAWLARRVGWRMTGRPHPSMKDGADYRQSAVRRRVIVPSATALGRGDRSSQRFRPDGPEAGLGA